jgi:hypothetical protein
MIHRNRIGILGMSAAALRVNNVGDRMPPPSPQAFTDTLADTATYSPIGRLIYVSAAVKF